MLRILATSEYTNREAKTLNHFSVGYATLHVCFTKYLKAFLYQSVGRLSLYGEGRVYENQIRTWNISFLFWTKQKAIEQCSKCRGQRRRSFGSAVPQPITVGWHSRRLLLAGIERNRKTKTPDRIRIMDPWHSKFDYTQLLIRHPAPETKTKPSAVQP